MANNRIRFSNDFVLKDEKIGINTDDPQALLDVGGVISAEGIVISGVSTFSGGLSGTISTATRLETPRTFEITGDIVASPITFDGTGNVSLAATIQPNSVELGTDTFGDYVETISGTANQITVTGGSGEGSTPVISIPDSPILPGNVTIANDLQVNNNLNVNGNITVGGTTAIIYAEEFIVSDKEIILGFTTDSFGNEVSNDITANGGGIAIASTEGYPLVDFNLAGIHTYPNTYKDIIWVKAGTLGAGTTDAWHFNYAVGIGSTQVPNGVIFAAGAIQLTNDNLAVVGSINASGIITANTFYGDGSNLTNISATSGNVNYASVAGVATYAVNAGVATYADFAGISTDVIGGIASITSLNVSGISTLGTVKISSGIVTATTGVVTYYGDYYGAFKGTIDPSVTIQTANYAIVAGVATVAQGLTGTPNINVGIVTATEYYGTFKGTLDSGVTLDKANYANVAGVATYATVAGYSTTSGISTTSQGLTGTPNINVGIVTATEYYGTFKGTLDSGVTLNKANYANVAGVATNVIGGIASVTSLNVSGLSTFTGIGTFGSDLYVGGNVSVVGVLTAQRLYSTIYGEFVGGGISGDSIVGTALSISGISTIGTVQISSGIVTATSGVVTYYGDGQYLSGVVSPASNGEFYTGVSSSIQLTPLSYETSIYTFPSTAGKQYVIESINVANVDTSVGVGTTVNIIASIEDSSGEQTYIAYNVPVVNGGLIELLKNPIVAGPSDVIKMWVTDGNYLGVNNAAEVYMNYTEFTSTEYIREYASTVSIATTDLTTVYTSSTYPSVIEAIHLANRTDVGDYPVSVTITNGLTTTYLAKDLLIPRYAVVDILDRPKRIEVGGTLGIKVGQTSTIDVIIAGKQITS